MSTPIPSPPPLGPIERRLGDVEMAAETIETVAGAFAMLGPSKNLYDPSLAIDGSLYGNTDGAVTSSPNYARSGLIPVEEGKRYAFTSWRAPGLPMSVICHFWGAAGASQYLGNSSAPKVSGTDVVFGSDREFSFFVPVGSGIRFVGVNIIRVAHTPDDFDAIRTMCQLEVGTKTSFEAFVPAGAGVQMKAASLPPEVRDADARLRSLEIQDAGRITIIKAGGTFYLRCKFNATNDLAIRLALASGNNGVTNWTSAFLCPTGTTDANVPKYETGDNVVHVQGDDATPVRYNGTTVGANHGHTQFVAVTATAHGKTDVDVGSRWSDGAAKAWTLLRVVDANTLWMLSDYTKAGDVYTFSTVMTGNLTHVSGAVHAGAITVAAKSTSGQIYPSIKGLAKRALLDGTTDISGAADQVYSARYFDVVNEYEITDLASVLDHVKSHPGIAPDFAAPGVETGARLTMTYRFFPNGSCVVFHSLRALKGINLGNCGFIQAVGLNQLTRRLYQYIPGVLPIVGSTKTWNFSAVEEITDVVDSVAFMPSHWADPARPPSRMVQVMKSAAGAPVIGFLLGYSLTKGIGVAAERKANVNAAIDMRNTKKQYPNALTPSSAALPSGDVPAGSYFEVVAYRSYFDPAAQPNATVCTYVEDGPSVLVFLDYHRNVSFESVALPARFRGRTISVVEQSGGVTVHNKVLGSDGILVSVTGGFGSAVLRLEG